MPTIITRGAVSAKAYGFGVSGGYSVSKSLRFRSSASAYLNRTPGSAGNRKTFTWSGWVKLGSTISNNGVLLSARTDDNNRDTFQFVAPNIQIVNVISGSATTNLVTTQVFRDPSAWYHIVFAVDTTQSTSSNRIKIYVNGAQVTSFSTSTYPSLNENFTVNAAVTTQQGALSYSTIQSYLDGYMAEINFVDGQALTPSSFGAYDTNGVWQPIKYSGSFGTNGFYLPFSNTTYNSPAGIGQDLSGTASTAVVGTTTSGSNSMTVVSLTGISVGNIITGPGIPAGTYVTAASVLTVTMSNNATSSNTSVSYTFSGNNWTPNNISLTAGSTYDSMTDSPTVSSASVANYATLNAVVSSSYSGTLSNGNLNFSQPTGAINAVSTVVPTSGKWYFEAAWTGGNFCEIGIIPAANAGTSSGLSVANCVVMELQTGTIYKSNVSQQVVSSYAATTDILGVAFDCGAGTIQFYKNGSTNGTAVSVAAGSYAAYVGNGSGAQTNTGFVNFGQRGFSYTPPTGFNALNTYNLPTPTIANGALYMAAALYTGNGSNPYVITNGTNNTIGTTFQPDLVWFKDRTTGSSNHGWVDSVRGVTTQLSSSLTNAETSGSNGITSLNSNGFTIGAATTSYSINNNGDNYVAWQWKAGNSSGSSNTNGSITSTVSANTTAGFSVVTYTGTGANATVGHGLGVAPSMIIVKARSIVENWPTWHTSLTSAAYVLTLNTTNAQASVPTVFNSTLPTSSVFSIGTSTGSGGSGTTYVAYCWAAVAGYSAFGSYTGNGSTDGPFVYTGFRPRWILLKNSASATAWFMFDSSRDTYNVVGQYIQAQSNTTEATQASVDFLSNGFKLRVATDPNAAASYIYAAFAENPFNSSRAR